MFNIKWGVIAGILAFALAFITSLLLGQTNMVIALVRASAFAVLFFGLGIGAWMLINAFIPELLFTDTHSAAHNIFASAPSVSPAPASEADDAPGSKINITLDDDEPTEAALPSEASDMHEVDEVGDFSDLTSGLDSFPEKSSPDGGKDVDQNPISDYNDVADIFSSGPEKARDREQGGFTMDFGSFGSSIGSGGGGAGTADLFSDSFSLPPDDDGAKEEEAEYTPPPTPPRRTGNKPMELKGDFNPKELAAGIRTVLEKEKRG